MRGSGPERENRRQTQRANGKRPSTGNRAGNQDGHRDPSTLRVRCVVRGVVQGVGFRWFVLQRARRWQVTGWVRNDPDGSVSVEMQGPRDALEMMRGEIGQGPSWARVESVGMREMPVREGERGFRVL